MKYKTFIIEVFELKPEKWRVRITREYGRPLKSTGRKLRLFVSSVDYSSAAEAMAFAMEMVDAGKFTRSTERSTERYWRRLTKGDRKLGVLTSGSTEGISEQ